MISMKVCFMLIVIVMTILGNILVVASLILEKRLWKVGNIFIVNLAVSDLFVGIIVAPVAVSYELNGDWNYGPVACDFWISMDIICCTASIVNLCVISYDRYNAITQPLRYACKRTPKRAFIFICSVWAYSICIAAPPLFGWRDKNHNEFQCEVTKDKGYTIYSTIGAFYFPLMVMLFSYSKVFYATIKRKKHWRPGPGSSQIIAMYPKLNGFSPILLKHKRFGSNRNSDEKCVRKKKDIINPKIGFRLMQHGYTDSVPMKSPSGLLNLETLNSSGNLLVVASAYKHRLSSTTSDTFTRSSISDAIFDTTRIHAVESNNDKQHCTNLRKLWKHLRCALPPSCYKQGEQPEASSTDEDTQSVGSTQRYCVKSRRKRKIAISQERRAAKTLGIIVGCFVICWLPFFLVALVRPFCPNCVFGADILTLVLWLGYINSALNPIIYTCFNKDFRRSFKRILLCRIRKS